MALQTAEIIKDGEVMGFFSTYVCPTHGTPVRQINDDPFGEMMWRVTSDFCDECKEVVVAITEKQFEIKVQRQILAAVQVAKEGDGDE